MIRTKGKFLVDTLRSVREIGFKSHIQVFWILTVEKELLILRFSLKTNMSMIFETKPFTIAIALILYSYFKYIFYLGVS